MELLEVLKVASASVVWTQNHIRGFAIYELQVKLYWYSLIASSQAQGDNPGGLEVGNSSSTLTYMYLGSLLPGTCLGSPPDSAERGIATAPLL